MKPGPEEIAFAQKRRRLSDELAPYFLAAIEAAGFPAFDLKGSIDSIGGGLPRDDTVYGQAFVFPARIQTASGEWNEVQLLIQHTEEWYPAVTVLTQDGGPHQTIIIRNDLEDAIPKLKLLIDDAIDQLRRT